MLRSSMKKMLTNGFETAKIFPGEVRPEETQPAQSGLFHFYPRELMDRSSARLRYAQHKKNAAARGIEWEFTFEEWCEIWEPHWERRGHHKDQLGMCRTRDEGSYRPDNVRLDTPKGNAGDRVLMRRRTWFPQGQILEKAGFESYGSSFSSPEQALEIARGERYFEPYE